METKQKSIKPMIIVAVLIGVAGLALVNRLRQPLAAAGNSLAKTAGSLPTETPAISRRDQANAAPSSSPASSLGAKRMTVATPAALGASPPLTELERFYQAFEPMLDPRTTFGQRQQIWAQLKTAGLLDQAISELERRAKDNPDNAEMSACLGQAYLQKAGTLKDVREQGMLGLKADQVFDDALKLDPQHWEARFMKAMAMSYWPPELNKVKETMEHFTLLIQQQEAKTVQPEFAQTYLQLGNLYQKQGLPDYARQTWERGAALFPNESTLKEKLPQRY